MTFGVLEAIGPWKVPESIFLETQTDGRVVFTFRNANAFFIDLLDYILQRDQVELTNMRAKAASAILTRALSALDEAMGSGAIGMFRGVNWAEDAELGGIFCSLVTMLQAFNNTIRPFSGEGTSDHSTHIRRTSNQLAISVYQDRMAAAGWCPSLLGSEALQWCALACTLSPFVRASKYEHRHCQSDIPCVIHNIDTAHYVPLHRTPSCTCPFLAPSLVEIRELLSHGHIPTVVLEDGRLVTCRADEGPYIAISHVWVDGLGSTTEAGLPTCQVERINAFVRSLLPDATRAAFWIDALCVPEDRNSRKHAIRTMAETYRGADGVLVLDAGIRTLCSSSRPLEENLLRITTAAWAQRVWTLQEALLAKALHFEFSDGELVSARYLMLGVGEERHKADQWWHDISPLRANIEMTYSLGTLMGFPELRPNRDRTITEVLSLLFRRTMSKPEDETLAIASLLDVDVGALLEHADQASRTRAFLLALRVLPACVLFVPAPHRIPARGFRWAPRALATLGNLEAWPDLGEAVCDTDGLTTARAMDVLYFVEGVSLRDFYRVKNLVVYEPTRDAIYSLGSVLMLGGRGDIPLAEFNAFVAQPGTFANPSRDGVFLAVAVKLGSAPDGNAGDPARPVVCEFGFTVHMINGEMRRDVYMESSGGEWKFKRHVMGGQDVFRKGRFFSSRVNVV